MKKYHDCMEVREEFSAYLDGELSVEEREGLEAHLAGCAECLRELDTMKRVDVAYRGLPAVAAPAGFESDVHEAVRTGQSAFAPVHRPVPRWAGPLVALGSAAAVLIVGIVVFEMRERAPQMQMAGTPASESSGGLRLPESEPSALTAVGTQAASAPDQGPAGGGEAWNNFARAPEAPAIAAAPVVETEETKAKTEGAWESFARAPSADAAVAVGREDSASALVDGLAAGASEADAQGVDEAMRERAELIGAPPPAAPAAPPVEQVTGNAPADSNEEALQTPSAPEARVGVGEVVSRRVLRSFKVRADGAWVESGYTGEPTTELKRGSEALNQAMRRHPGEDWDKMLNRTAVQILQLDGVWYSLEGKPAEE